MRKAIWIFVLALVHAFSLQMACATVDRELCIQKFANKKSIKDNRYVTYNNGNLEMYPCLSNEFLLVNGAKVALGAGASTALMVALFEGWLGRDDHVIQMSSYAMVLLTGFTFISGVELTAGLLMRCSAPLITLNAAGISVGDGERLDWCNASIEDRSVNGKIDCIYIKNHFGDRVMTFDDFFLPISLDEFFDLLTACKNSEVKSS